MALKLICLTTKNDAQKLEIAMEIVRSRNHLQPMRTRLRYIDTPQLSPKEIEFDKISLKKSFVGISC